ncbi:MAG: alginate export family protein [Ahniella sp.]|nr:alginate export family protein [Ahniella sp.]
MGAQAQPAPAAPVNPWALEYGTFSLDSRLRYESVDDAGFADTATALTWRNRLGFRSKAWHGFSVYVEAEDVRALIDDYPVSAAAGNTRPVITDPEGAEWNQFNLVWDSGSGVKATLGRQRLVFDNHRFFGNVGWRQNEQTFDAAAVNWTLPNNGVLDVVWLDGVHRIFGRSHPNPALREWDLNAPLLHYTQPMKYGSLSAYAYFVENEDLVAQSARTMGVRFAGKVPTDTAWQPVGTIEYARQSDWADAVSRDDQDYRLLELGLAGPKGHVVKAGWEVLGGDGRFAFQTPFATLHAFNGWADRFLTTPVNGLDDRYVSWTGPCGKVNCALAWHEYESDRLAVNLGREFNASVGYAFTPRVSALVKYARFSDADALADVDKFWVGIEYKR